jgi:hypothetical protein
VLRLFALGGSLVIAAITGAGMMAEWPDARALLVRARSHQWRRGPDFSRAAELLSVHPARVATGCRMASLMFIFTSARTTMNVQFDLGSDVCKGFLDENKPGQR